MNILQQHHHFCALTTLSWFNHVGQELRSSVCILQVLLQEFHLREWWSQQRTWKRGRTLHPRHQPSPSLWQKPRQVGNTGNHRAENPSSGEANHFSTMAAAQKPQCKETQVSFFNDTILKAPMSLAQHSNNLRNGDFPYNQMSNFPQSLEPMLQDFILSFIHPWCCVHPEIPQVCFHPIVIS